MPYRSDAQRRFFHSKGAHKAGITPATVKEWDDASRGQEVPERVEKKAQRVLYLLGKMAAAGALSMARNASVKPAAMNKPKMPGLAQNKLSTPESPATLTPNSYQSSFLENSGASAQRGSGDRLSAGESLTMPG